MKLGSDKCQALSWLKWLKPRKMFVVDSGSRDLIDLIDWKIDWISSIQEK